MNKMKHSDFIKVLSDFARYYPLPADPLNRCQRLNCFAMVEDPTQVLDDNFGMSSHEKDFFFSRAWEDSGSPDDNIIMDTPSLTVVLYQVTPLGPFSQRPGMMSFSYDFLISDILRDQKEGAATSLCDQRNENQILDQCARFFSALFIYLKEVIHVKNVSPPAGQTWGNSGLWEALASQGVVSYDLDLPATKHWTGQLGRLNSEGVTGDKWKSGNRLGINLSLDIELDFCQTDQFDLSKTAFTIERNQILIK